MGIWNDCERIVRQYPRSYTRFAIVLALVLLFLVPYHLSLFGNLFGLKADSEVISLPHSDLNPPYGSSTPSAPPPASTADIPVILVSAYFPLSKSKHPQNDFKRWMELFLGLITTEVYMFVPPEMAEQVYSLRGALPITVNTTFETPWDVPMFSDPIIQEKYQKMQKKDREKSIHSPSLYAVWNAKAYFLDEAVKNVQNSGKTVDYAFWSDAGSFRQAHGYRSWPDVDRLNEVWAQGMKQTPKEANELLFFPMWDPPNPTMQFWQEGMGPLDNEFSEGSFFGGHPEAISWWRNTFYAYHDQYLALDVFVGKDQTVYNAILMTHPQRIITVWYRDPEPAPRSTISAPADPSPLPHDQLNCGPTWYYYQYFLASAAERKTLRGIWDAAARWPWNKEWWHWQRKTSCQLRSTTTIFGVLRRVLGMAWNIPQATIA